MDYGRIIFSTNEQLEKNNDHKPLVVTNCGLYIAHNKRYSFLLNPQSLDSYLLVYLHKGRILLPQKDNQIVEGGTVLIFSTDNPIYYDFLEDETNERYYIYFKGTYAREYMKQFLLSEPFGVYHIGESATMISYFSDIMNDFKIHGFDFDVFRTSILLRLLAHVHKKLPTIANTTKETEDLYLVVDYMEKNYWKQLSLEHYAKISNMSIPSLMRNFKKEFNSTPHAYLNNIRLAQAKNLLITTNLSINDLSLQIGFNDPLYFCKFFKQKTGFSPSEYRKKHTIRPDSMT